MCRESGKKRRYTAGNATKTLFNFKKKRRWDFIKSKSELTAQKQGTMLLNALTARIKMKFLSLLLFFFCCCSNCITVSFIIVFSFEGILIS